MRHRKFEEWLVLLEYGELGEKEKQSLEEHLASCQPCRKERDRLKNLRSVLNAYQHEEVTDGVLDEARQQLRFAVRQEESRGSMVERIGDAVQQFLNPRYRLILSGAAMLFIGVLGGYLLLPMRDQGKATTVPVTGASPVVPGDTRITNVRFVSTDLSTGKVEFMFDAVKPVRVSGNIGDEQVQKILMHALLTEDNPGVRLRSVSTIAAFPGNQDKEIKFALITSLKTDENAGVRNEALKTLRNYPMDQDIKEALLYILNHDKNPGIRIAAINYLESSRIAGSALDRDVLDVFRERMKVDDNNYIRIRAKAAIKETDQ